MQEGCRRAAEGLQEGCKRATRGLHEGFRRAAGGPDGRVAAISETDDLTGNPLLAVNMNAIICSNIKENDTNCV